MRLKIIAGNFVVVLLVGVLGWFIARSQLMEGLTHEVDSQIINDSKLLGHSLQLRIATSLRLVENRAETQPVLQTFAGLDQDSRRSRAHQAANGISQWLRDPSREGRHPDIVVITDDTGKVLARDQDPNRLHNARLDQEIPTLRRVLSGGEATFDVWVKEDENKVFLASMAPIEGESGGILGALVVGYELSNSSAERSAELLGHEVAFLTEGAVYSSSLENTQSQALSEFLFSGDQAAATNAAITGQGPVAQWQAELADESWVGVTSSLPGIPSHQVAYVVMFNRSTLGEITSSINIVLYLALFGAIFVLVYGFIIGTGFLRPVEQIEEGVLAVINGQTDFRLDIESAEFGGLAYRINQLINVFTGVSEETDDGRVSTPPADAGWQGSAFDTAADGGTTGGGGGGGDVIDDPAIAASLEAEPEDAYLSRVYGEYVQAKTAAGENVGNIRQEVFTKRLSGQAVALAKKHGVRMVRFQVEASGTQVSLKPVLIR